MGKMVWTDIEKLIKVDLVDAQLRALGIEPAGKTRDRVIRLQAQYKVDASDKPGTPALADCSECTMLSPVTVEVCPFCGTGGIETEEGDQDGAAEASQGTEDAPTIPEPPFAPPQRVEVRDGALEVVGGGSPPPARPGRARKPKPQAAPSVEPGAATSGGSAETIPVSTEPEKEKIGPAEAAEEKDMEAITHTNGAAGDPAIKQYRNKLPMDLDKCIERLKEIGRNAGERLFDYGNTIKHIFDNNLWQQRVDGKGKAVHPNFKAFCEKEFGAGSYNRAYKCMNAVDKFDREQFAKLGSKLLEMVRLPEVDRTLLLEEAVNKNLSKRQIEARATELNAKNTTKSQGVAGKRTDSKARPGGSKAKAGRRGGEPTKAAAKTKTSVEPSSSLATVAMPKTLSLPVWRGKDKDGNPKRAAKFDLEARASAVVHNPGADFEISAKLVERAGGVTVVLTTRKLAPAKAE